MKVLAAFDSFKGTASARDICRVLAGVPTVDEVRECPLSDGGDGFLDILADRWEQVDTVDALGHPCVARLGYRGSDQSGVEVILETAEAIGLTRVGGAAQNDPIRADSTGVAILFEEALKRTQPVSILIGCGGSAVTDGGLGFIRRIRQRGLETCAVPLRIGLDVQTRFSDAAAVFAPQKGAGADEVKVLASRLKALRRWYQRWYGLDLDQFDGTGAAGGLSGAFLALGAILTSGFDEVAGRVQLARHIGDADLVMTGEGRLDMSSFDGKVVGGVLKLAESRGKPVWVVVGSATAEAVHALRQRGHQVSVLSDLVGPEAALTDPLGLLARLLVAESDRMRPR
ncbi:glycerate kinase [Ferrimicrobium sp.]|uniref:glycerate kinase n=1 Tax=Ferrimicrobium sp. TaxID=2926050 RepID=UPI00262A9128|nr:glycerate kinase [Ferrimicrobium sp.]